MLWKPDTCDCIVTFDVVGGVDTNYRAIKICSLHSGLTPQEAGMTARRENICKNLDLPIVKKVFPDIDQTKYDEYRNNLKARGIKIGPFAEATVIEVR